MTKPSVRPVVWTPPRAPARSSQPRSAVPLPPLTVLPIPGNGPEDVVLDGCGRIITGVEDGRILRVDPSSGDVAVVVNTGGRPLGIERLADGRFLVCDAYRGLLALDPGNGSLEKVCDNAEGEPLRVCNNAAVAADGTIYFTDSSRRFDLEFWKADLIEHSATGRLLRLARGGSPEVVLDGLAFANGVALAPDESAVYVAETGGYCVHRVALTGARAGTADVLVSNLPGFPDNISAGTDGLIWIALGSRRDRVLDRLSSMPPLVRRAVWALPDALIPDAVPTVWVMAVDAAGGVVHDLQAPGDAMNLVTGVREVDGRVYLGSLVAPAVAFFDLPRTNGAQA